MKKTCTILLLAICHAFIALAKDETKANKKPMSFEDSVLQHYLREGAWKQPIFSRAYERYVDSAIALCPKEAYFYQQRAMPLIKQNKYEAASPYLDSAAKYKPYEYVPYRAFSKCIFSKEYRAAIADFELARSINGNSGVMDHPYDFYTGLCYMQLNQFDSAEHYIRKCIDHSIAQNGENWVHYMHWFYLGVVRYEQDDYKGAITFLDKAMKDFPDFCDAEYYKANALARMGAYADALPIIRKAKLDMDKRYTMNEDNVYYETYPYQVKHFFMRGAVEMIERKNKTQ